MKFTIDAPCRSAIDTVPNENTSPSIPTSCPTDAVNQGTKRRLLVMASCLTSERHGGILAQLEGGATNLDELAENLPAGTSRDRLVMLLLELREAGFVGRATEAGPPLRVSYRLTDDGRKVLDLTTFLSSWLSDKGEDDSAGHFWTSLRTIPVAGVPGVG